MTQSESGYDSDGNGNGCQTRKAGTYPEEGLSFYYLDYGFYSQAGYSDSRYNAKCNRCPNGKSTKKEITTRDNDTVFTFKLKQCLEGIYSFTGYHANRKGSECKKYRPGTHSQQAQKIVIQDLVVKVIIKQNRILRLEYKIQLQ
ncbi:hypothetical protein TTHERM_00548370 (macronuclear) [Tetrahymena thermophila SB210]|uniref:Uncharacterized protein n=1 Tax=Tetrahymena thermophila (strain SB210) TaxID=312017 RepID=I7M6T5_TETTS|nr:hypothetical protein TTHERM_00548370 [Tetrahymena thermophila SB210]EAR86090.2 hypothetical protein TTHERM_00548370 [Tetrahymena thermophila SB210]|eukprot:XP_976685.2 hypothetical protein TTHERM_00548370 [Tetrahymena thermophila SB210]